MERGKAVGEIRVAAIHGECVLHEVVGPDAEEVHVARERVARHGRGRRLDHDTELHIGAMLDATRLQLLG